MFHPIVKLRIVKHSFIQRHGGVIFLSPEGWGLVNYNMIFRTLTIVFFGYSSQSLKTVFVLSYFAEGLCTPVLWGVLKLTDINIPRIFRGIWKKMCHSWLEGLQNITFFCWYFHFCSFSSALQIWFCFYSMMQIKGVMIYTILVLAIFCVNLL